ncbi:OLC1v1038249C1 [Oldenlandia corymbosa var. corymbosa]|uniref:OLC1v1038249C1 n=1 Tax=Oldenlandia corymbosa var. corymbosa TaxID=529605 RepID=A0AAV1D0B0_OLDCO|nr:OLC1v1038249C1 [Oldenlandia corymbosa var. corymbosa]
MTLLHIEETLLQQHSMRIVYLSIFLTLNGSDDTANRDHLGNVVSEFLVSTQHLIFRQEMVAFIYPDDDDDDDGSSQQTISSSSSSQEVQLLLVLHPQCRQFRFLVSSQLLIPAADNRLIFGDFVDSLLKLLWNLLIHDTDSTDILNHQMQKLFGGLTFLQTLMIQQPSKFDELYKKMHALIELVVCEAGIIVIHLSAKEKRSLFKRLEILFSKTEKYFFKLIEAVEEEDTQLMLASEFPQTNQLGFTDSLLMELKSKMSACDADSTVSSAKDKLQALHGDLTYLRSFLVMLLSDQNPEFQSLRSSIAAVAYETEFALDSFTVKADLGSFIKMLNDIIGAVKIRRRLLLEILNGLGVNFAGKHLEMNEDDLAHKVSQQLRGKKYLIVLDDVWDIEAMDSLRGSFPNDANVSRILLTSRHHNVALQIKPDREPHNLRSLTSHESWELMRKKVCFDFKADKELLARAEAIAHNCNGLPLMILVVAGLLSNMGPDTWEEAEESNAFFTLGSFKRTNKFLFASHYGYGWLKDFCVLPEERSNLAFFKTCYVTSARQKCNEEHFLCCLHGPEIGICTEDPSILYRLRVYSGKDEDLADFRLLGPRLRTLFATSDVNLLDQRHWYEQLSYWLKQSKLLTVLGLRNFYVGVLFPAEIESICSLEVLDIGNIM